MTKITYLIPVFNEVKTISEAINNIKKINYPKKEILVIDNGSTDGSKNIIKKIKGIKKILRKENLGIAETIRYAFKEAKGKYIFRYDADLEYDYKKSINILKFAERKKLDVVFLSRLKKNNKNFLKVITRPRFIATLIITFLINLIYGKKFTDVIGTKLYRTKIIKKVPIDTVTMGFEFAFISRILKMKLKVDEKFINYTPRKYGESVLKFYDLFNALYQILRIKFLKKS
jgi:glycosyltransferase involved in cell wall biosynthesis